MKIIIDMSISKSNRWEILIKYLAGVLKVVAIFIFAQFVVTLDYFDNKVDFFLKPWNLYDQNGYGNLNRKKTVFVMLPSR